MSADKDLRSIKGDFIGFTFGGIHSSELGLIRVSDGSRYNEDLLPPLQDKKAQVSGRDGEVYFGSQYVTKPIKVPVAFDNMNEKSLSDLRRLLSSKTPQILWFDETPYKQWLVKSANAQSFKWICFDESRNGIKERIYKGEGTIEFNCFNPYASSRITYLDEIGRRVNGEITIDNDDYSNFFEWNESSKLRWKKENANDEIELDFYYTNLEVGEETKRGMFVYNAGDIPTKPKIICSIPSEYIALSDIIIKIYSCDKTGAFIKNIGQIVISKDLVEKCRAFTEEYTEKHKLGYRTPHIIIDSKLKMIKGAIQTEDTYEVTGHIYNKYHKSGDYIEMPVSDEEIYFIDISENAETKEQREALDSMMPEHLIKISSIDYTHQYY